jgi:hypothetical protein
MAFQDKPESGKIKRRRSDEAAKGRSCESAKRLTPASSWKGRDWKMPPEKAPDLKISS